MWLIIRIIFAFRSFRSRSKKNSFTGVRRLCYSLNVLVKYACKCKYEISVVCWHVMRDMPNASYAIAMAPIKLSVHMLKLVMYNVTEWPRARLPAQQHDRMYTIHMHARVRKCLCQQWIRTIGANHVLYVWISNQANQMQRTAHHHSSEMYIYRRPIINNNSTNNCSMSPEKYDECIVLNAKP